MKHFPKSALIFEENRKYLPGAASSLNRVIQPEISFVRGKGSRLWDADGNEYIDYPLRLRLTFWGTTTLTLTKRCIGF